MFAPAALLDKLFRVAVAAADPAVCIPPLRGGFRHEDHICWSAGAE